MSVNTGQDHYELKKGANKVVKDSAMDKFLLCMDKCTGQEQTITSTTDGKHSDPGHAAGTSVDVRPTGTPSKKMFCCAGKCGGKFAIDERKIKTKTKHGTGPHYHFQLKSPNSTKLKNAIPSDCKPDKDC